MNIPLFQKIIVLLFVFVTIGCSKSNKTKSITLLSNTEKRIELTEIDTFLEKMMDSLKIPGVSVAIINDAKVVYHKAAGISNIDTKTEINGNSIFEAASLSKPVFAYFALKMAEKGVIDLDRPLFFYLPDDDMEVDQRYKEITARMVLSHTTGFPNWRWFDAVPDSLKIERGSFYMKAPPGTFTYSGEGYQYLARVMAHNNFVNMYELSTILQKEVAQPLDIQHAYFVWDDYLNIHKVYGHQNNEVDGREWGSGLPHQHSKIVNAAGGLHTEALSYSKFLIALLNRKGLSDHSFDLLLTQQTTVPNDHRFNLNEDTVGWSLGMAIEEHNGKRYVKHGGNNGGFMCGFLLDTEHKNGYVYFLNNDKGEAFENALRKLLLEP